MQKSRPERWDQSEHEEHEREDYDPQQEPSLRCLRSKDQRLHFFRVKEQMSLSVHRHQRIAHQWHQEIITAANLELTERVEIEHPSGLRKHHLVVFDTEEQEVQRTP